MIGQPIMTYVAAIALMPGLPMLDTGSGSLGKSVNGGHIVAMVSRPETPTKADGSFGTFWSQFVQAVQTSDRKRVKAFTHFPFPLGGNPIAAHQFETLWTTLFTSSKRKCLAQAKALTETDGSRTIFCGQAIFVFRRGPDRQWRFVEVSPDD